MTFTRSPYFPGILLFIIAVLIGLSNYQDYGMAWDETAQHEIGMINYDYVFHGNRAALDNFVNKDYGPAFEVGLMGIERALNIESYRDIYLMRHIVCHIFFIIGCLFAYLLAFRMHKKVWLAVLAFLVVYLFPRFYAHSFFNSKDIVFLSLFFMSFWAIYMALETKKIGWFVVAGLLCGYTTGIRVLGVIIPAVTGLVFFMQLVLHMKGGKKQLIDMATRLAVFAIATVIAIVVFWPFLWTSPVNNFIESYGRMAHFRWFGWMLVNGRYVHSTDITVTYFPIWFAVTVPLVWLLLGGVGTIWFLVDFLKKPKFWLNDARGSMHVIFLLSVVLPVGLIIITRAVIYDDWRHLYFIFAGFSMFIIFGIAKLSQTRLKIPVIALAGLQLAGLAWFMVKNHPFQQVYFNELVSREPEFIRRHYEMDYWGVSTKQALEFVLAHDTSSSIKVTGPDSHTPLLYNIDFLTDHQRQRIVKTYEADTSADYFINFFRYNPDDRPGEVSVYDIRVLNSTILRVSKQ